MSIGTLLVLSGPSGVGKGAIGKRLLELHPELWWSVSWATRAPRRGELDGVDYTFVSRERFEAEQRAGGFLESFEVYGDLKGTPAGPVLERLEAGQDVLVEVDVQGALTIKARRPDAVLVFVKAPSREAQRARFTARAAGDEEQLATLERRLDAARAEEALVGDFDHVVVNGELDQAVSEVAAILEARRRR